MSILIKPTKIKDGFYLLVPKSIAELINIKDNTEFRMEIENKDNKIIIKYIEKEEKRKVELIKEYVAKVANKIANKIRRRKK